MQRVTALNGFYKTRAAFFTWRQSLPLANKVLLALGMATLTGILAQVKIFLPWTPVPVTGQTFAVLLAGILLGRYWGGISQLIYVTLGVAGIPWFAGLTGGSAMLIGPRGGYIIGFVLAAFFLGHICDKYLKSRKFMPMFLLMLFANFVFIHLLGLFQLSIWLNIVQNGHFQVSELLKMGTFPFIVGDIVKILAAASIATAITPKK